MIFVYDDLRVQFHSSACEYLVLPAPFIEEAILSSLCVPDTLFEDQLTDMRGFVSGLSILFHSSMCLFLMPVPYRFDYNSFVIFFKTRKSDASSLVLLVEPMLCNLK